MSAVHWNSENNNSTKFSTEKLFPASWDRDTGEPLTARSVQQHDETGTLGLHLFAELH